MKICVYGASSNNINPEYIKRGEILGKEIAKRGHSVVFGGGGDGLMGAVSRGALSIKGEVIGISPRFFEDMGALRADCTKLIYTDTMRERKQLMEQTSDAFVVTPGGVGTFEEFFEIFTARQLVLHQKPIVIYNINGYYNKMIDMIEFGIKEGFIFESCRNLIFVTDNDDQLFSYIENYVPPKGETYKTGA